MSPHIFAKKISVQFSVQNCSLSETIFDDVMHTEFCTKITADPQSLIQLLHPITSVPCLQHATRSWAFFGVHPFEHVCPIVHCWQDAAMCATLSVPCCQCPEFIILKIVIKMDCRGMDLTSTSAIREGIIQHRANSTNPLLTTSAGFNQSPHFNECMPFKHEEALK